MADGYVLEIRPWTIPDFEAAPNCQEMLAEYAKEFVVDGAPPMRAKMELYRVLETSGAFRIFGAFVDSLPVGLITVLVTILPHYSVTMAVTESFFVFRQWRKTGAGLKLLRVAEDHARANGSSTLLVSAPCGGDLAKVLPHVGYKQTNSVFFRKLPDA